MKPDAVMIKAAGNTFLSSNLQRDRDYREYYGNQQFKDQILQWLHASHGLLIEGEAQNQFLHANAFEFSEKAGAYQAIDFSICNNLLIGYGRKVLLTHF